MGSTEGIKLERIEPHGHHRFGRRHKVLWRALGAVPAIGIGWHRFTQLATKQLVNGDTERFTQNIPASNFDRGHRRTVNMAAIQRHTVHQGFGQAVDLARVLPQGEVLQLVHRRLRRLDETVEGALTNAIQAAVSTDLDQQPIFPASAHGAGLNRADLHGFEFFCCAMLPRLATVNPEKSYPGS